MNNKTDIEEDINRCKKIIEDNTRTIQVIEKTLTSRTEKEELEKDNRAIENILADREKLIIEKEIQEDNYEDLSTDVSNIAKKLDLQEDATIDEIHIAIRILKSKRTNMFEYTDKANKYDSLVEKIKRDIEEYPEATYTKYYLLDCLGLLKGE